MKGKGNLPFRSVKGLKRVNSSGFVNHLYSKYSEFTVVKGKQNSHQGMRKGYDLSREGSEYLFCLKMAYDII